jgi:hypothetical protein
MDKNFIFISCGQFTDSEIRLGNQIKAIVEKSTKLEAFFADEVHDLKGLHANVLDALQNCVAFIVVLHPRGKITRPDGSVVTRASVWIEQEIAIAAYIQHAGKPVRVIAFKHASVDIEGLRCFLHLNPFEFTADQEVLLRLPELLEPWKSLAPVESTILLNSATSRVQDGHQISRLEVTLVNNTGRRIKEYTCDVRVPADILKHWGAHYVGEVRPSGEPGRRLFRFTEADKGSIEPGTAMLLLPLEYCTKCAADAAESPAAAASAIIEANAWIDGRPYGAKKSIEQLALAR